MIPARPNGQMGAVRAQTQTAAPGSTMEGRSQSNAPPPRARPTAARGTAALACALGLLAAVPGRAAGQEIASEARIRNARIVGDLGASQIFSAAAKQKQPDLLRCYRDHLTKAPGVVGLLALTVKIDSTGKAAEIVAQPSRLPAELVACAKGTLAAWQLGAWKVPHRVHGELELVFQRTVRPAPSATIRGGVPPEVVAGTIEARLPALREACWKGGPPTSSPLLRFVVDFDGTSQTADLSGRVPTRAAHACLLKQLRAWDFPPPDNGYRTWVYYPLFPVKSPGTPGAPRAAPPPRRTP